MATDGLRRSPESRASFSRFTTTFGVLAAVALALGFQLCRFFGAAVGEPIQSCAGETLTAEDLGPALERQVGGHDQAITFVRRRDDIEQEFMQEHLVRRLADNFDEWVKQFSEHRKLAWPYDPYGLPSYAR